MKYELSEVFPFVNGDKVRLFTDKQGTLLYMSVKDFLALADEVRRKHETPISR